MKTFLLTELFIFAIASMFTFFFICLITSIPLLVVVVALCVVVYLHSLHMNYTDYKTDAEWQARRKQLN